MNSDFPALLKRLEQVTGRLEQLDSGSKSAATPAPTGPGSGLAPSLDAFDQLLNGPVDQWLQLSEKVGGVVQEQALLVKKALYSERQYLDVAAHCKNPAAAPQLQELLKSTSECIQKTVSLREENTSSPLFNHLSTVSEGIPALGWIAAEPKPAPYIGEMKDAAQFYANRVMKEFKDKDKVHVEWSQAFTTILMEMQNFVKKYHTTGVVWNSNGGETKLPEEKEIADAGGAPPSLTGTVPPLMRVDVGSKPTGADGNQDKSSLPMLLPLLILLVGITINMSNSSDQIHGSILIAIIVAVIVLEKYPLGFISNGAPPPPLTGTVPPLMQVDVGSKPTGADGSQNKSSLPILLLLMLLVGITINLSNSSAHIHGALLIAIIVSVIVLEKYPLGFISNGVPPPSLTGTVPPLMRVDVGSKPTGADGKPDKSSLPTLLPLLILLVGITINMSNSSDQIHGSILIAIIVAVIVLEKYPLEFISNQINKGPSVISGLEKMDTSLMTHKNAELNLTSVVKNSDRPSSAASSSTAPSSRSRTLNKNPKISLDGNKWTIEYHENNRELVIDQTDLKQIVYIYACNNCTIQIKGKVNAVTVEKCAKTKIIVENGLASLDIINCKSLQAQILGRAPAAIVDKTDGLQLFLSRECLDIEVFSAKSSETNMSIPAQDDYVECPIPV